MNFLNYHDGKEDILLNSFNPQINICGSFILFLSLYKYFFVYQHLNFPSLNTIYVILID